jgi:segregation and condensation protein B
MEISQLIPHVEALIFAADRPLPVADILELLNNALAFLEDRATQEQVEAALEAIQEKYNSEFYAFSVRESGGGYQFLTKKEYYQTVAQLNGEKFLKRLSTAALETLAIIAYRQPISKGEIEHIRGVSTDYSITKLLEKELIVISGRSEDLPGKPLLYSTSKAFMDYFGLNSPKDLPKLKEVFDEDFVPPTQLSIEGGETLEVDEEVVDDGHLVVSENGELTETTTIMMDDEVAEENDGLEQESEGFDVAENAEAEESGSVGEENDDERVSEDEVSDEGGDDSDDGALEDEDLNEEDDEDSDDVEEEAEDEDGDEEDDEDSEEDDDIEEDDEEEADDEDSDEEDSDDDSDEEGDEDDEEEADDDDDTSEEDDDSDLEEDDDLEDEEEDDEEDDEENDEDEKDNEDKR